MRLLQDTNPIIPEQETFDDIRIVHQRIIYEKIFKEEITRIIEEEKYY